MHKLLIYMHLISHSCVRPAILPTLMPLHPVDGPKEAGLFSRARKPSDFPGRACSPHKPSKIQTTLLSCVFVGLPSMERQYRRRWLRGIGDAQ